MLLSTRPSLLKATTIVVLIVVILALYKSNQSRLVISSLPETGQISRGGHKETSKNTSQQSIKSPAPTQGQATQTTPINPTKTSTLTPMAKPTGPAQPKASKPQSAVGQLQAVAQYNRSVIMGKTKSEDGSWVKGKLASWRPVVYSVDEPTSQEYLHIPVNKGKEAMPYLTYIIDYYDDLSDINVFAHAHEKAWPQAWHNELLGGDYSIVTMLERLQLENVRKSGYVNLRCNGTPGCPAELHPTRKDFKKDSIEIGFRKLWEHLYGNRLFPSEVGVACCAQFAVTRERIRERPKAFYESVRSWILWTDEQDPGRTLEYFWHIIFGMPPVHCDSNYNQCICKTFGCGAAW